MCYKSTQNGKVLTKISGNPTNTSGSFSHRHHRSFTTYIQGNRWVLTAICLDISYVFPMKEKSTENVIQAYLLGILPHKGGSLAILSYNGSEVKDKLFMKHVIGLELKGYSPTHSTP